MIEGESYEKKLKVQAAIIPTLIVDEIPFHVIYYSTWFLSLFKNYFVEKWGAKIEKNQKIGKCQLFFSFQDKISIYMEGRIM